MDENTKKDIAIGVTGIVAAATTAGGGPVAAVAAAGVVALVSTAWSVIAGRDLQRSERLFVRMADADDSPDDFIAYVRERADAGDDEMLTKLRALIRADLESASPDAHVPIARLGHAYVRGKAVAWAARGWLRLLSEATGPELDVLRDVASAAARARAAIEEEAQQLKEQLRPFDLTLILGPAERAIPNVQDASPEYIHVRQQPRAKETRSKAVFSVHSSRIFMLMNQHGVATDRADLTEEPKPRTLGGREPPERPRTFGQLSQLSQSRGPRPVLYLFSESAAALLQAFGFHAKW